MNLLKVLHIISGGDTGGAKTHVLTLLEELKKDIDVSILCVMEGKFTSEAIEKGIDIKIILQKNRFDFKSIRAMKEHILTNNFDIIHCHGARANYIATMLKLIGVKKPFLTTIHSDYLLDFTDNLYKKVIFTKINVFALKRFDYFCAVTENFKQMLNERGFSEKKIFTIYNGINTNIKHEVVDKKIFLEKYGLSYDENVLYVGIASRLNYVKGIETFLKCANELKNENIIFLIAGSGEEKDKYLKIKKDNDLKNVHFLGQIDDIFSFYNVLDINTLTSISESFPYALLEGGLMKKATTASKVGGIPEMIEDGVSGFLFEKEDYTTLSNLVVKLKNDKILRQNIGDNFYDRIINNFSSEKMKQRHIEIYKTILEDRR